MLKTPDSFQWVSKMIVIAATVLCFSSSFITTGYIVSLGVHLILTWKGLFRIFFFLFECEKKEFHLAEIHRKELLVEFVQSLLKLKKCLRIYGQLFGCYALLNIFHAGVLVGYSIYCLIWPRDGSATAATFMFAVLNFGLVVSLGNGLQLTIERTREKLREQLLLELITTQKRDTQVIITGKSVISWKWSFSTHKLFVLNNSLVPAFLGALVTCLTFIIQLDMSETKAQVLHCPSNLTSAPSIFNRF
ncbi:unnamed protein product [Allacma fusca]|uniref:Uncharacterized protein n=1 Tax=Allacma fusca TaxID=39272 RepID=A0A8J2P0K5_9HEXA|nr:unnamed protein product [Allacma fusca]